MRRLLTVAAVVLFIAPTAIAAANSPAGTRPVDNLLRDGKFLPRPVSPALARAARSTAAGSKGFDYSVAALGGGAAVVAVLGGVLVIHLRRRSLRVPAHKLAR